MDMEYKYFDKIDVDYIRLQRNGDCNNLEKYNRINCAKEDKYKDCDLDNISTKIFKPKVLEDIYYKMVQDYLSFKDKILMYKWFLEEHEGVKGVRTIDQIKDFFKEIIIIMDIDEVNLKLRFDAYVTETLSKVPNYLDKYDYKKLASSISPWIYNATETNLRYSIEEYTLPPDFERLRYKSLADVWRFLKCFEIPKTQCEIIFGLDSGTLKPNTDTKLTNDDFSEELRIFNPNFK